MTKFTLTENGLTQVDNGGDGFIKTDGAETQVFLYSGSANITKAGRIAVELLCDTGMKVPNTTKVFVSHPLKEVNTVEMIACQWVMENRPSDDGKEILAWLESLGLKDYEARIINDRFVRFVMWSLFKGVKLVFVEPKTELKAVK